MIVSTTEWIWVDDAVVIVFISDVRTWIDDIVAAVHRMVDNGGWIGGAVNGENDTY